MLFCHLSISCHYYFSGFRHANKDLICPKTCQIFIEFGLAGTLFTTVMYHINDISIPYTMKIQLRYYFAMTLSWISNKISAFKSYIFLQHVYLKIQCFPY